MKSLQCLLWLYGVDILSKSGQVWCFSLEPNVTFKNSAVDPSRVLLADIAHMRTGKLAMNSTTLPDTDRSSRMGNLVSVNVPSSWEDEPYPIAYSATGPFTGTLPSELGVILTDESVAGYSIRKQLLDTHNLVRQLEAPEATYMLKLTWDFHLEAYATQWAQFLCTAAPSKYFEHSPDAWPWRVSQGENLYTTSALRTIDYDFSDVVFLWYDEKSYYNWQTGKADPPGKGPVGHYTQLVRQETSAVGCAVITNCKTDGDWRTHVVCHYDYGNVGKYPYERRPPARAGRVCDNCPAGFDCCEINLCFGYYQSQSPQTFSSAKVFKNEWYGCTNYRRPCSGTGALFATLHVPGDHGLEFQTCHCGRGAGFAHLFDTVAKGYFLYRNQCYKIDSVSAAGNVPSVWNPSELRQLQAERSKAVSGGYIGHQIFRLEKAHNVSASNLLGVIEHDMRPGLKVNFEEGVFVQQVHTPFGLEEQAIV